MRKSTMVLLIVAICLVIVGIGMFPLALAINHWDLSGLEAKKYEINTYDITESFTDISIETDTAGIWLYPSEDETCKVVCRELESVKHTVAVKDGVLTIQVMDQRKWYDHMGIHWEQPKVTLYLPKSEYGRLIVKSDSGEIQIPGDFTFGSMDISADTSFFNIDASVTGTMKISGDTGNILLNSLSVGSLDAKTSTGSISLSQVVCAGDIFLEVSTGRCRLEEVRCGNLRSVGHTGNLTMEDVVVEENISLEWGTGNVNMKASTAQQVSITTDTGDVRFEACDANEIIIHTDTGDVTGTLLTPKIFQVETDTGRVDIPASGTGGKCEIKTDTGDIQVEILE